MKHLVALVLACLIASLAMGQQFSLGGSGTGTGDMLASKISDSVAAVLLRGATVGSPIIFSLSSSATGDIFYRAATTGYFTRLAIGTGANNRLGVSSGLPAYLPSDSVGLAAAQKLQDDTTAGIRASASLINRLQKDSVSQHILTLLHLYDSLVVMRNELAAKLAAANFRDSARQAGLGIGSGGVAGDVAVFGAADSLYPSTTHTKLTVPLYSDIVAIYQFGLGSGQAGDTTAMVTGADMGGFYWKGPDSLEVTSLHCVLRHGIATDTCAIQVYWHATLGSGSAATLNTAAYPINSITTGNEDVAFLASTIPPGVQVWGLLANVVAGQKPTQVKCTISGYRKKAL